MAKKKLVIVESPAKARTLGQILGSSYTIKASLGHVRDLPKSHLGIDVEGDFTPKYLVPKEKAKVVRGLKEAAKGASAVYLATDPDREGEAISWHLVEAVGLDRLPVRRVVFHEITRKAVEQAFQRPHSIDMRLVDAQQARRILDRLVGYKLSPLLWQKVRGRLSAGRVQSVALRMIADREREIREFMPVESWTIEAELTKAESASFRALLLGLIDGTKLTFSSQEETERVTSELERARYLVAEVRTKETSRNPAPPFITSSLQQEASRKLRFTAEHTMAIAQQLYEGLAVGKEGVVGLITYMRTDSTRVAASAVAETRDFIGKNYGAEFLPPRPRLFSRKVKGAQEAHEAIRPTGIWREPASIKPRLTGDQFRLYELIWRRMLASQMSSALVETTSVDIEARGPDSRYLLRATSSTVKFPGFTVLYSEGRDEAEEEPAKLLPELAKGNPLDLRGLFPEQHFTQPQPRYTEATLIKALEENGIGRPSTYAPILSVVQARGYVQKVDGRFHPLQIGLIVNDLLTEHFPDIVDLGFTAQMERQLDEIARGKQERASVLQDFYIPFERSLSEAATRIEKVKVPDEPSDEVCPSCGKPMVVKLGRYGKFLACSGYPQCKTTRPFLIKVGVPCPQCGGEVVKRLSRKKRTFYGCANFPQCRFISGQRPLPQPCPQCGGLVTQYRRKWARCQKCGYQSQASEPEAEAVGVAAQS
ncbi:MAG: type I DNA topoisomerase [Dehalococcoidia bacterium]